jgi:hypothetical protein
MDLGGALEWPSKRSDRTFGNRHVIRAVEVKQSQGVLGAVVYIGIAANACHRKEIDLRPHNGTCNR